MSKKFKRVCAAVVSAALLASTTPALNTAVYADTSSADKTTGSTQSYSVKGKKVDLYVSPEIKMPTNVYFVNGKDIPYVEMSEAIALLNDIRQGSIEGFNITVKPNGNKLTLTRENTAPCTIDFKNDTVYFMDYNMFVQKDEFDLLKPLAGFATKDSEGRDIYLKEVGDDFTMAMNGRYGNDITMDLGSYNIDLVRKGSKYYIPMQTFNDIFMYGLQMSFRFNGKYVFFVAGQGMLSGVDETELGKLYYSTSKKGKLSKEFAEYNYNEMCFALDIHYGLKEVHNIDSFDILMRNTGLKEAMLSGDPTYIDTAMYVLASRYLNDKHTFYGSPGYATDPGFTEVVYKEFGYGSENEAYNALLEEYTDTRKKYFPKGVPAYQEIGNTAYITFDTFFFQGAGVDYYKKAPTAKSEDTIGIIAYSVQQILRKNSPVKNVVLDLSCNGGGEVVTAYYTIGAFLGKASMSTEDSFTGALATSEYVVDTNFDYEFDEKDTLAGKGLNLYCLESNLSFSCGNMVPCMFKQDPRVTLLGQTSGGGACSVMWMNTAYGTEIRISSPNRVSFLKNGSFYDVDRGATPDYYIGDPDNFYNRKKLTNYINSLM